MIDASKMSRLSYVRYMYNMAMEQSEKPYPLSTVSILLFHDCIELFLQLVSEHLGVGKSSGKFIEYWNEIEQKTGYRLTQKDAMGKLNSARNILKHSGMKVDRSEINIFRVSATNFFEENTHPVFGINFNSISMASLVHDDEVRQTLDIAESLANQGNLAEATGKVSIAFKQLLNNFDLNLLEKQKIFFFRSRIFSGFSQASRLPIMESETKSFLENVEDALKEIGDKIKITSLGIDYKHYLRFSLITPYVYRVANGQYGLANSVTSVTLDEYTFCYNFVVESAFRIQELELS